MKRRTNNTQTAQTIKMNPRLAREVDRPKALEIERRQKSFIEALRSNGGNVSAALTESRLARRTAYDRYASDPEFAFEWNSAMEEGVDGLYLEAQRRALGYDPKTKTRRLRKGDKPSDTLLIFLLKQGEYQKRWRTRVISVGQLAMDTISEKGSEIGLSETQVRELHDALIAKLNKVPLF